MELTKADMLQMILELTCPTFDENGVLQEPVMTQEEIEEAIKRLQLETSLV